MKKLILLGALSVLLYSAPGYATKRPGTEAEEMEKAFEGKEERERRAAALAKGELVQAAAKEAADAPKVLTPEERAEMVAALEVARENEEWGEGEVARGKRRMGSTGKRSMEKI